MTATTVPVKECGAQGAPALTRGRQGHCGLGHGHPVIKYPELLMKTNHRRCSGHTLVQVWSLTPLNKPAGTWLPLTASSVCTPYPQEGRLPSYFLNGHMTFLQHTRAKMRTTEDNTGRGSLYLKHLSLGASGLSFTITGSLWLR